MLITDEIIKPYKEQIRQLKQSGLEAVNNRLAELNLANKVVRVRDNKVGYLRCRWDHLFEIQFYHITKKGTVSELPSGCVYSWLDIERDYVPYEGEAKNNADSD